jgi:hypothetical protein
MTIVIKGGRTKKAKTSLPSVTRAEATDPPSAFLYLLS